MTMLGCCNIPWTGFAIETFQEIGVLGESAGHHLDGDHAADATVSRFVDDAHAALAQDVDDIVLPDLAYRVRAIR